MKNSFSQLTNLLLKVLIFIFPLFFLPITQEFYLTNKFYLLGFGTLLLLVLVVLNFVTEKKLNWKKSPFDTLLIFFLITQAIAVVISAPNKIQALLSPVTGFATFFFLILFYLVLSNHTNGKDSVIKFASRSAVLVGVLAIFFFFNPFGQAALPQNLQFLKNANFSTLGTQLDLALFLGFFVLYYLLSSVKSGSKDRKDLVFFVVALVALSLSVYNLVKPISIRQPGGIEKKVSVFDTLPPYSVSWYAAVETLKQPRNAFFGVGQDNLVSLYTKVKPIRYNQSVLWNVNFNQSRSLFLQIWTESGLFGFVALLALSLAILKKSSFLREKKYLAYYLLAAMVLFPPSLPILFLFFLFLSEASNLVGQHQSSEVNLSNFMPAVWGLSAVMLALILGSGYFLGRAYAAEFYFKKSLDSFSQNNGRDVYANMRKAILTNPYVERYRINFAQTNLLIASNLASKGKDKITEQDRQIITQAIQAAIQEAKAAVALNQMKSSSWENLAIIYRNIINVAQGADVWTVASYQRAIFLDPQNPIYRINLGGVYYSLGNYEEAAKLFDQAVALKPDFANGHYNLAWANFQRKDYRKAATSMQNVLSLLDPKKNEADYKKAQAELEEFKKNLPTAEEEQTQQQPQQLRLPQAPSTTLEPKIQLPKEASPEAK